MASAISKDSREAQRLGGGGSQLSAQSNTFVKSEVNESVICANRHLVLHGRPADWNSLGMPCYVTSAVDAASLIQA